MVRSTQFIRFEFLKCNQTLCICNVCINTFQENGRNVVLLPDNPKSHSARILQKKYWILASLFFSIYHIHSTWHQMISIFFLSIQNALKKKKKNFSQNQVAKLAVRGGCKIDWLHLCRGVKHPPNECPGYDTKQSDDKVPVMQGHWGMRSTPSLPLLPGPLWPGMVPPDRVQSRS